MVTDVDHLLLSSGSQWIAHGCPFAFQLGNVIQKLSVKITVELEGMELIVLNAILNDLIVAPTTNNDAVIRLAGTQRKVQEQVSRRYKEILDAQ